MVAAPRVLPDLNQLDPASLKALILSQHEQLISRDAEIEQLKLLIAKLRRMQFGRKSEKLERQIEQLELRLDELEASRAENAVSSSAPVAAEKSHNETSAAAVAGTLAARDAEDSAEADAVSGLRRRVEAFWAKMFRRCWSGFRRASK